MGNLNKNTMCIFKRKKTEKKATMGGTVKVVPLQPKTIEDSVQTVTEYCRSHNVTIVVTKDGCDVYHEELEIIKHPKNH